jgi:DNA-binding NarL/FixJ family response regulator
MLDSGISGYILKNTGREELIRALHTLAKGENYFSPEITRELATAVKSRTQQSAAHLTNREIEIIRLIARDLSNKQIAGELFISERTVETHRKNILRKTGNQTAIGLVKYAYDNKII